MSLFLTWKGLCMFNCFYFGHPYKFSLMEGLQDLKKICLLFQRQNRKCESSPKSWDVGELQPELKIKNGPLNVFLIYSSPTQRDVLGVTSTPFLGPSPCFFLTVMTLLHSHNLNGGSIKSSTRLFSYPAIILFFFFSSKLIQLSFSPSSTQTSDKDHSPLQSSYASYSHNISGEHIGQIVL